MHSIGHTLSRYAILLYTTSAKKQRPICTAGIIFCFAQKKHRYSVILFVFSKILQKSCQAARSRPPLPDAVFAMCLLEPAQLIGLDQLFQVIHPLPQHLALIGLLHEDAVVLGLQDVFLREDVDVLIYGFFGAVKGRPM